MGTSKKIAKNSFLISFEGIEGSGKSTQINKFAKFLNSLDYNVLHLREPGGTDFGEKLRQSILSSKEQVSPTAQLFLFLSSRAQLIEEKILPHLSEENSIVILDRYIDSTLAYQGVAGGLGFDTIINLHKTGPLDLMPSLSFYIKIDYQTSLERQKLRGDEKDFFEAKSKSFYQKLIQGYDQAANHFPRRIKIIDGKVDIDSIQADIQKNFKKLVSEYES